MTFPIPRLQEWADRSFSLLEKRPEAIDERREPLREPEHQRQQAEAVGDHPDFRRDAKGFGVETIYQTLALADNVDAAANMFLGREIITSLGSLNDAAMESATREVMSK